jgi:predicted ABC-type ATPase
VTDDVNDLLAQAITAIGPLIIVLAGPNGSGKSTFFDVYLRASGIYFVNADEMAKALGGPDAMADAYSAARVADQVRRGLVARREQFCMETVLSDPGGDKVAFLREAQNQGYRLLLIAIRIESAQLSIARVQQRVESGGHDVPDDKLLARFPRTQANIRAVLEFADLALVFDNSRVDLPFQHVETWIAGRRL